MTTRRRPHQLRRRGLLGAPAPLVREVGELLVAHLRDAFTKGTLKPVLDHTFPLVRLADTHAYMLSDAQTGKIVLTMAASA